MSASDLIAPAPAPAPASKRICIVQSCYIPWKGFFDLIGRCDEYVIFDQVQFAKRHWHNRNVIKTPTGPSWLTIPVVTKSRFEQPIDEVEVAERWAERHWRGIKSNYARAPWFAQASGPLEALYGRADGLRRLTEVNEMFLRFLSAALSVPVKITRDTDYRPSGRKSERLIDLCRKAGATAYLSGPSALGYLDEAHFHDARIAVEWMRYGPYPEYAQLHGRFEHAVSVIDVIFNLGPKAAEAIHPLPAKRAI